MQEFKKEIIVYLNTLVATNFLLSCMEEFEGTPLFRHNLKALAKRFRDQLIKQTEDDINRIWGIDDSAMYNIMDHQEELLKQISLMRPEECGVITEIIKRYQTSPAAFRAWLGVKIIESEKV